MRTSPRGYRDRRGGGVGGERPNVPHPSPGPHHPHGNREGPPVLPGSGGIPPASPPIGHGGTDEPLHLPLDGSPPGRRARGVPSGSPGQRRTRVLGDPVGRQALHCIRCSACLNICPVYSGWVATHITPPIQGPSAPSSPPSSWGPESTTPCPSPPPFAVPAGRFAPCGSRSPGSFSICGEGLWRAPPGRNESPEMEVASGPGPWPARTRNACSWGFSGQSFGLHESIGGACGLARKILKSRAEGGWIDDSRDTGVDGPRGGIFRLFADESFRDWWEGRDGPEGHSTTTAAEVRMNSAREEILGRA